MGNILEGISEEMDNRELWKFKLSISKKYGINGVLRNSEILNKIPEEKRTKKLIELLRIRKTRTISGVAPIAVMTKSDCPHGRCSYCPKGENAPQSYTGKEPAALRGIQNQFNPYKQVRARLLQLREIGHPTDKCELIIMGGTFTSQPLSYKKWFLKGCLDGLNGVVARSLKEAQRMNEKGEARAVGITIETRPNCAKEKDVDELLEFGVTRVELGVQTLYNSVYKKVKRGHSVEDVVYATKVCKDSLLKVGYHMMPGLFADKKRDIRIFRRLFSDQKFRPDQLKIYPCMVLRGTEIYELWKKGKFTPYTTEEAADVIGEITKFIPPYVRVMRIQRDIPSYLIEAGVKKSNLRQIVDEKLKEKGIKCACIRCREAGIRGKVDFNSIELRRMNYVSSDGYEVFLSFEDKYDTLVGFLRLRYPSEEAHRVELKGSVGVRELHIYGSALKINEKPTNELQHRGFGRRLLEEAEKIAIEEFDAKKIFVLSGIGAKEYYKKLGYKFGNIYMYKELA